MSPSRYTTGDEEVLVEIQEAAERRLDAQLTTALAADQRALVFAGFAAAAAAALGGTAASLLAGPGGNALLGWLALAAAVGMTMPMAVAIYAARPRQWWLPGGRPDNWTEDIATAKPRVERLQELAADYDDRIVHNDAIMADNARWLRRAIVLAFATLILSALFLAFYALARSPAAASADGGRVAPIGARPPADGCAPAGRIGAVSPSCNCGSPRPRSRNRCAPPR